MASLLRSCDRVPHFVGGFADYYSWNGKQSVFKVPKAVPDNVAAGANCALSQVLHGLEEARLRFGDTVVVQGAGGLGLFACAVAREMGAEKIIAIDSVPERLEMARAFGADEVIDMNEVPDPRKRVGLVMSKLDHWGADVVVEVAGVPEAVPEGIRMLGRGGRYLELGNINPRATYKADPSLLVGQNRSIIGVSLYPPDVLRRAMDFLNRTRERYPFEKLLSHDFELANIDAAFELADIGGHTHEGHDHDGCPKCTRVSIVPSP
jgi:threonine dehydrogenase-like Zn-dependent dehydrogenase